MLPFVNSAAQKLLDEIKNGTNIQNVSAMIMVSEEMVISETLLEKPLIVTQIGN